MDASGNIYVVGMTSSGSAGPFPTTTNAFQTSLNSPDSNGFVAEFSNAQAGTSSLLYSSYLGGSFSGGDSLGDYALRVAVDASSHVFIAGVAASEDFPVTSGAYQTSNNTNGKVFVAKMDLTQSGSSSLIYSTLLGGTGGEDDPGIAVDASGNAFVVGTSFSTDFPTTTGAFQSTNTPSFAAFLTEINPTGTGLIYSTYLGGTNGPSWGGAIALDPASNIYVVGGTNATDFPVFPSSAFQTSLTDADLGGGFALKLSASTVPYIKASASPSPNGNGWNNSSVTVGFTCIPGVAPIQTCTSPNSVTAEGANQIISGSAVDTASNVASASVTVNLDLTAPAISITSPIGGAALSSSALTVTGTVTDSLSGVNTVTCNGVTATISGSNFPARSRSHPRLQRLP